MAKSETIFSQLSLKVISHSIHTKQNVLHYNRLTHKESGCFFFFVFCMEDDFRTLIFK